jgi:hypothetical protein
MNITGEPYCCPFPRIMIASLILQVTLRRLYSCFSPLFNTLHCILICGFVSSPALFNCTLLCTTSQFTVVLFSLQFSSPSPSSTLHQHTHRTYQPTQLNQSIHRSSFLPSPLPPSFSLLYFLPSISLPLSPSLVYPPLSLISPSPSLVCPPLPLISPSPSPSRCFDRPLLGPCFSWCP